MNTDKSNFMYDSRSNEEASYTRIGKRKHGTFGRYKYDYPEGVENRLDWGVEFPRLWQKYKWKPPFLIVSVTWVVTRTFWRRNKINRYNVTDLEEPWHWRLITGMELRYERWKKERAVRKAKEEEQQ